MLKSINTGDTPFLSATGKNWQPAELNGSARKKLRLKRDFNVLHECVRLALVSEGCGNGKVRAYIYICMCVLPINMCSAQIFMQEVR